MKCPNCRCEVGTQQVCPYCGTTVYLQEAYRAPQSAEIRTNRRKGPELRDLDKRLRMMETKVNLCLTLQSGTFAIVILMLFILALR
jgi:hypothetical protein